LSRKKRALHRVKTNDGWRIALWNYPGSGRKTPVLLVHGLGSNRHDLDSDDERYSLARYLHQDGYDVWVVELRGAGASNHKLKKALQGFTIDDYVLHDIPAALKKIEDETGANAVHWIGHSLGGSLAYPLLATAETRLRSAVTLGAPTMQRLPFEHLEFALPVLTRALRLAPYFWGYRRGGQVGSYFIKFFGPLLARYLFTLENCDLEHLASIGRSALDDVANGVNLQMLAWYKARRMTTHYGTVDPIAALPRTRTPLLVVVGNKDRLTPADDVKIAYDASGSPDKELLVCGPEHGFSSDYGHIDLVFGRKAKEEVFPRLRQWLAKHDVPAHAPSAKNGAPAGGTGAGGREAPHATRA
jgi:pimeloyl-ACP methyl ester carboxylesterase